MKHPIMGKFAGDHSPKTPMGRIAGTWPGDETDEQIFEGLAALQPSRTCEQLRTELLTACIECHEYLELFQRCMELVERYGTEGVQSVESEPTDREQHIDD